jgi:outer membrane protein assembly factor BamB
VARSHGLHRAWWRQAPVDNRVDEVENITLHGDTLYVQTRRGTVSALDAASGQVRWTFQIGSPHLVTSAIGANDTFAGVVNGTKLYVLAHDDGKIAFERTLKNVPGAGPALSKTHIFTPTTNGSIEAYEIADVKQPPQIYNSTGRAMNQPFCVGNSLAWTTDRGLFYVAQTEPLSPRFRVETNEPILVGPAYQPPYLYVGSMDGHVLKVHELTGNIVWKIAVGEPVDSRPSILGDRLMISSRRGGLRCVLAEARAVAVKPGEKNTAPREGAVLWHAPTAGRLLAGSEKRLYCLDELGRMSILRRSDGGYVDSMPLPGAQLVVLNDVTDRIYIATRHGAVQCLHEAGLVKPISHRKGPAPKAADREVKQKSLEPDQKAQPKEQDADFGGDDLFGGQKKAAEPPAAKRAAEPPAAKKAAPPAAEKPAAGDAKEAPPEKKAPKVEDSDGFGTP